MGPIFLPEAQLVHSSVPQGCPLAPLALVCVLREAVHDVGQTLQYHGEFHQSVFLDDRATVVHTPEMAMRFINLWEAWSARLGFEENLTKLQVV